MNFKILGKSLTLIGIVLFLVYLVMAAYYSSLSLSNMLILNEGAFRAVMTALSLGVIVISYFMYLDAHEREEGDTNTKVQNGGSMITNETVETINDRVKQLNSELDPEQSKYPYQLVVRTNRRQKEYTIDLTRELP